VDLTEHIRPWISGKRVFLAVEALAGATSMAATLTELGAASVAVISEIDGAGHLPTDVTSIRIPGAPASSMMDGIRGFQAAIAALPPEALDAWDPDRTAVYLCGPFDRNRPVAGRSSFGGRTAAAEQLEDKTTIDALWERAGLPRVSYRIVNANESALLAASDELDEGLGTVWVADNREGWHGGGDYLRWVDGAARAPEAVAFMQAHADTVRVMPFLDGIPCSIHGLVLPDRVLAFRPVEMVILRRPGMTSIQYAGLATLWDPAAGDRADMREAVRRVGAVLRSEIGYRGAFGIDGIMTADGFRPTELNARLSGGLGVQASQVGSLHLGLINRLLLEGEVPDIDWALLEHTVIAAADNTRSSRCLMAFPLDPPEWTRLDLAWNTDRFDVVDDASSADATLQGGDHAMGTALLLEAIPGRLPAGPPFGPFAVAALDVARARGLEIPEVTAALDVRDQG